VRRAAAVSIRYETVHAACFVGGSNMMLVETGQGQGHPFWVAYIVASPCHMLLWRKHKNILNIFYVAVVLMFSVKNRNFMLSCVTSCVFMWTQKWEKCIHSSSNSQQYLYQRNQCSVAVAGVVTRLQDGQPRNWGLVPGRDNRLLCPKHPDQLWGSPNLFFNGYCGLFPWQ